MTLIIYCDWRGHTYTVMETLGGSNTCQLSCVGFDMNCRRQIVDATQRRLFTTAVSHPFIVRSGLLISRLGIHHIYILSCSKLYLLTIKIQYIKIFFSHLKEHWWAVTQTHDITPIRFRKEDRSMATVTFQVTQCPFKILLLEIILTLLTW